MIYQINDPSFSIRLADAIKQAKDGDTIEVGTQTQAELAERAMNRMCPEKQITVCVKMQENNYD